MPLLELKELKRLGYGFGIRQQAMLATAYQTAEGDIPSPRDTAALVDKLGSCLPDGNGAGLFAAGDSLSFVDPANWAGALQRRARIPVFASPILLSRRPAEGGGETISCLFPYADMEAARMALVFMVELVNGFCDAAAKGETGPALDTVATRVDEVVGKLSARAPNGVNTYRICEAAFHERIPFSMFFRDMLLLGEGVRLRRMLSTITDEVSAIGVAIARNKMQTAMSLRQAGFPTVRHAAATSEDHAVTLAGQTGFPTVVKPADADGGAGVSAGLMTEAGVRTAYRAAREVSKNVIVEAFVTGNNYRVHVCNGRIVKTTLRRPGGVEGDGVSSIRDLVEGQKDSAQSQRRRLERGRYLLELDEEAQELLAEAGLSEASVPAAGEFIALRRRSNVSTGGTTTDVKGTLHPDNEDLFRRAANLLGLDFAGIDYISPDISKSWCEVPSAICEINAQPQLGNDLNPTLYNELLREYLGSARVPWVLVLGGDGASVRTRSLGERIRKSVDQRASPAVVASASGVWSGASRISGAQGTLAAACESVLLGRFAAAAVVVADPSLVIGCGLPTEDLEFVVLTNEPRASASDFELCRKLVGPHIRKGLLLEPGDPALPVLRAQLPAQKLFLVSPGPADQSLVAHLSEGGRAVWLESKDGSSECRVVMGAGDTRVSLGSVGGAGTDARIVWDALVARVIQVHLPAPGKPADLQQGSMSK